MAHQENLTYDKLTEILAKRPAMSFQNVGYDTSASDNTISDELTDTTTDTETGAPETGQMESQSEPNESIVTTNEQDPLEETDEVTPKAKRSKVFFQFSF